MKEYKKLYDADKVVDLEKRVSMLETIMSANIEIERLEYKLRSTDILNPKHKKLEEILFELKRTRDKAYLDYLHYTFDGEEY